VFSAFLTGVGFQIKTTATAGAIVMSACAFEKSPIRFSYCYPFTYQNTLCMVKGDAIIFFPERR
jgi:hypothetical protein